MNKKRLYTLHEKDARNVSILPDGLLLIDSKRSTDIYKTTYDRFVPEKHETGFFTKVTTGYRNMMSQSFSPKPPLLAKIFTALIAPVPPIRKKGTILDIGCSTGNFLQHLPKGWKRKGLEINKDAAQIARAKGLDVSDKKLEDYKTKEKFDYVRASHVIEHIKDYEQFADICSTLVKKGGRLLIYTPNSESLSCKLFKEYWEPFYEPTHFVIFDLKNIEELFAKRKFRMTTKGTYYMGFFPSSVLRLLGLSETSFNRGFLFLVLYAILFPFSLILFVVPQLNLGGSLYIEFEKYE